MPGPCGAGATVAVQSWEDRHEAFSLSSQFTTQRCCERARGCAVQSQRWQREVPRSVLLKVPAAAGEPVPAMKSTRACCILFAPEGTRTRTGTKQTARELRGVSHILTHNKQRKVVCRAERIELSFASANVPLQHLPTQSFSPAQLFSSSCFCFI